MSEAELDMEGWLEWVHLEPETSPTVSNSSDDDTDSTESDGEYDSEHDPDLDMHMEDDVDAPDGVNLDSDVDMERDGDDAEEEDKEVVDKDEEDEEEEEDEDEDEDDGKEPRTISQGEIVNTSGNDVDTMVNDHPIMLPDKGQKMREHTSQPEPPGAAPRTHTPEPRPPPRMPETHPLTGLEDLGLVTPQKRRPAVRSQREAEAAGNTTDLDVDQQLLGNSAGGDCLPKVPLPDVPLPDVPLPAARPDGSVGEEWTIPPIAEEVMVGAFR